MFKNGDGVITQEEGDDEFTILVDGTVRDEFGPVAQYVTIQAIARKPKEQVRNQTQSVREVITPKRCLLLRFVTYINCVITAPRRKMVQDSLLCQKPFSA